MTNALDDSFSVMQIITIAHIHGFSSTSENISMHVQQIPHRWSIAQLFSSGEVVASREKNQIVEMRFGEKNKMIKLIFLATFFFHISSWDMLFSFKMLFTIKTSSPPTTHRCFATHSRSHRVDRAPRALFYPISQTVDSNFVVLLDLIRLC